MHNIAVVGYGRTPFGRFGGSLAGITSLDLGAFTLKSLIQKYGLQGEQIERVIIGENIQVTRRGDPARHVLLKAGLPEKVDDYSINMNCASGMNAVVCAAKDILLGERGLIAAGGMETMSQAPFLVEEMRWGKKLGGSKLVDFLADYLLVDAGLMAENLAEKFGVSREAQDEWAFKSQEGAIAAIDNGKFRNEIIPVPVKAIMEACKGQGVLENRVVPSHLEAKQDDLFDTDEHPRRGTTMEKLAQLRPVFKKEGGTVTAGNSSGINDGSAMMLLASQEKRQELGLEAKAVILAWEAAGVEPMLFGLGPIAAVQKLVKRTDIDLREIKVWEINEAFAAVAVECTHQLGLDSSKVNINGGAVALGHPVGATGPALIIKTITELERQGGGYGIATMCIGSGQGQAVLVKV